MKSLKSILCILIIQCFLCSSLLAQTLPLVGEGVVLMEASTGAILYSKNPYHTFYPASTTKVLTTLLLAEDLAKFQDATVIKSQDSVNVVPWDSSHIGLGVGDAYDYLSGLYGIMLASDNFISHDMARLHSGSISSFTRLMNQKAKSIGAIDSHFANPHGYHDPDHYTTPYDLALITRAAFHHPLVEAIGGTAFYPFPIKDSERVFTLRHTAPFFNEDSPYYNPHIVAAKTGFHTPAGRTLVAKGVYDHITLIAVVMKSERPVFFEDINTLLDYGASYFSTTTASDGTVKINNNTYAPWALPAIERLVQQGVFNPPLMHYDTTVSPYTFYRFLTTCFTSFVEGDATFIGPTKVHRDLTLQQAQYLLETLSLHYHTVLPSRFVVDTLRGIKPSLESPLTLQEMLYLVVAYQEWLLTQPLFFFIDTTLYTTA